MLRRLTLSVLALAGMALPALAHASPDIGANAFSAGFTHPLLGLDHILALAAVGVWGALLGGGAVRLAPTAFLACLLGGFALALTGASLPAVAPGIAAWVVVLGILIAATVRLPLAPSVALVGLFVVFHGRAHGAELTGAVAAFGLGFVAATALLRGAGIALGQAPAGPRRLILARGLGGAVAGIGLVRLGGLA